MVDIDPDATHPAVDPAPEPALPDLEEVYEALTIGTRDYVRKNGLRKGRDWAVGGDRFNLDGNNRRRRPWA